MIRTRHFTGVALAAFLLAAVTPARAQTFNIGADIVSRYIWRGTDLGESASIQPVLSIQKGGFEIGTWASYAVNPESATSNEHDLWVSFSAGPFSIGATDYYFPNLDAGFFDFDGNGSGAHYIEPFVSITTPTPVPITFYAATFIHNDPDHSVYLSASAPLRVGGVDLALGAGASATRSAMYRTSGFGVVDFSLAASKSIPLTDSFALPLRVAYILNPTAEKSFLVLGLSF